MHGGRFDCYEARWDGAGNLAGGGGLTLRTDWRRASPARRFATSPGLFRFDLAARERKLVAAPHLPFPGAGHLRADGEGYAWVPLPYRDREGSETRPGTVRPADPTQETKLPDGPLRAGADTI